MIRAVLLLALAAGLAAVVVDPTVRAESPWDDHHGYSPVIVTVDSLSPRALLLEVTSGGTSARLQVAVPAGSSRHCLLLPPRSGGSFAHPQLAWRSDDGMSGGQDSIPVRSDDQDAVVLIDPARAVDEGALETGMNGWNGRHGRYGGYAGGSSYERLDPELLPDRWQGYPEDLVVLLHRTGVERLGQAQRRALDDWARVGGLVHVIGGDPAALGLPHAQMVSTALDTWGVTLEAERQQRQRYSPDEVLVPGTEEVPVGAFALLAVAFALVVGPLNLWWAVRRGQRWLLLVTTPVLSAATCLVLVVVNLVSEGLTVRRVADQLVLLDGAHHEAVVWTGVTSFAPFAGTSAELDPALEITHIDPGARGEDHRYRRVNQLSGLSIDWTKGQAIAGTWLPARINRRLLYTQPRALRQRLLLRRDGEQLVLTNGLEVPIVAVEWRDARGDAWHLTELAPGASQALVRGDIELRRRSDQPELGAMAAQAWSDAGDATRSVRAQLAGPAVEIPGFGGSDERPPSGWLCGPLHPEDAP